MASHLKGVKKSTLIDEMRKALCEYKNEHPSSSQKDLQQWVQQTFDLSIKNSNVKRHKSTKYPNLENVLYEWFLQYQEKVNMTGEIIQTKAKELLHGIKSYRRFGESGSIIIENIEYALPQIRAKLKIFYWKDIYNMDETSLFYRLQAYHSLARKQLEGRKKDNERLTIVVCYNGDGSDKVPLWVIIKIYYQRRFYSNILERYKKGEINLEKTNVLHAIHFINVAWNIDEDMPLEQEIGDVEGIHKLKEVISDLHYRNVMDEDIIQGVMDNYLIQQEKNIPDLVYALLKAKDEIVFDSHAKKKQLTINAYFSKE
ncbi:hypothetical protein ES288_D08G130100v1 [Gossypium darwinii]|uniref:HTH CENPB-type domain-containing protein n=1 Tax=Gossypium darwinii TaxID=34276 RepID=A0A5D2BIL3_GOSDA|nr:hypothetical protein ES288_D08G130100v1 [Gossypium darwinii]